MISTTDFHDGLIFENENGEIVEIMEYQHHRKSQARAVVRVKLRNLNTNSIIETSYRPEDKFKEVNVEKRPMTFSYKEGDMYYFMDSATYDQVGVGVEQLGNNVNYLKDDMEVTGLYINDVLMSVVLPIKVILKVESTVPGVKGDTVSNLSKPATLESGIEIKVPLFINEGDKVVVDTRTATYVERAEK
ncbi:elongation factor P [Parelusimicrobium proximum]|uniref:elongation factor P n=1 Tax=Parelusimicrobium proximum TaxID=3228953 RepID=UPI003D179CAA